MAEKTIAQKLGIKAGFSVLVLEAPPGYLDKLGELPDGVTISTEANGQYDLVQFFATNRADITRLAQVAVTYTKPGGLLWVSYPKKSSGMPSDLQRESTFETMSDATHWRPVMQISLDDVWSALRFRPQSEVKSTNTRFIR